MTLDQTTARKRAFGNRLLRWYRVSRRDLPWRRTKDPYRIWVSEIMLQQTRVNAVMDHYRRFLRQFPTVRALAACTEPEVLAAWSGLGYYQRARRMRQAAKEVVEKHRGRFPASAAGLRTLPGIGRYTAAAIASIAYEEPRAVVDGNVERVAARLAGGPLTQAQVWEWAESMLPKGAPGDFNQAMMELGALVCTPQVPRCGECPVREFCAARGELEPQPRVERLRARAHYGLAQRGDKVLLVQRGKQESLMAGMWELPAAESNGAAPLMKLRHSITTTDYEIFVYAAQGAGARGRWIPRRELASLPLTGLARKILQRSEAFATKR